MQASFLTLTNFIADAAATQQDLFDSKNIISVGVATAAVTVATNALFALTNKVQGWKRAGVQGETDYFGFHL